jgi:hypothetical protein
MKSTLVIPVAQAEKEIHYPMLAQRLSDPKVIVLFANREYGMGVNGKDIGVYGTYYFDSLHWTPLKKGTKLILENQ